MAFKKFGFAFRYGDSVFVASNFVFFAFAAFIVKRSAFVCGIVFDKLLSGKLVHNDYVDILSHTARAVI